MSIVKVNWSGGKDSTCAVLQHLAAGNRVKCVCYIPMFTDSIPFIRKAHYEFIVSAARRLREMGCSVFIVRGEPYVDFVLRRSSRGKFKGRMFGFPCYLAGRCNFQKASKTRALTRVEIGDYDFEDIGIAWDETSRHGQLTDLKRSILVELKISEKAAFRICEINDFLSPVYSEDGRDGCALCPHGSRARRVGWFSDYPDAFPIVRKLQEIVQVERPGMTPLRNGWFIGEGGEIL